MRKPRSKVTSLRFSEDFYARVKEHADEDEHSVNELIVRVLAAWMDGKQYQPMARPLDAAAKARQAAANAPYKRPRGRPMARAEGARQPWLIDLINARIPRDSELSLDEIVATIVQGEVAPNFPTAVERNLVLAGWQQAIRSSDDAIVWLGPEHPGRL